MRTRSIAMMSVAALAACSNGNPAATIGPDVGKRYVAEHGVVASGNPYASEAGVEMLRKGGNAVDAAVAATFAIGVVEPMMSGLGAGGGMLVWNQRTGATDYLDFYSAAGAAGGVAVHDYTGSRASARGVAIPGGVAGLLEAQSKYGRLPRATVMEPAIRLARDGFTANSLLAREVAVDTAKVGRYPGARRIFLPDGHLVRAGDHVVQPELAATLQRIASEGASGFYRGPVAEELIRVLAADASPLTLEDLAAYRPQWKRPLCTTYRGRAVLSAPPPQSGMEVLEALNLLEETLPANAALPSRDPAAFRSLAGALRVAVADRGAYVGDPAQAFVPAAGVSSKQFAKARLTAATDGNAARTRAGNPWAADSAALPGVCAAYKAQAVASRPSGMSARPAPGSTDDELFAETTHLSIVDDEGNAVSLTNTNGLGFGTGTWAEGFFLNSAMYNFARSDTSPNSAAPHKVPASTIAPTILLSGGRVQMVVGSPGSAAIPPAVVQTIMYTLDYGFDPMQSLRMPRIIPNAAGRLQIEDGFSNEVLAEARRLGFEVATSPPTDMSFGGVHVIYRVGNRWVGAADPRRDGEVRGY